MNDFAKNALGGLFGGNASAGDMLSKLGGMIPDEVSQKLMAQAGDLLKNEKLAPYAKYIAEIAARSKGENISLDAVQDVLEKLVEKTGADKIDTLCDLLKKLQKEDEAKQTFARLLEMAKDLLPKA